MSDEAKLPFLDVRMLNRMPDAEVRRELEWELNKKYALIEAFLNLPDVPHKHALLALSEFAEGDGYNLIGKQVQTKCNQGTLDGDVPPVSECESGAGLWATMLPALKEIRRQRDPKKDEDN